MREILMKPEKSNGWIYYSTSLRIARNFVALLVMMGVASIYFGGKVLVRCMNWALRKIEIRLNNNDKEG